MLGVDANQLTAVATAALTLIAIATAVIAWTHRGIAVIDVYQRLMDRVETPAVAEAQRRLRRALGSGEHPTGTDLRTVLNALELVGLAVRRRMVSLETVWTAQGDRILFYWFGCQDQIRAIRDPDPTIWEELNELVSRLQKLNKQRGVRWGDGAPTPNEIREYFAQEAADAHEDDQDADVVLAIAPEAQAALAGEAVDPADPVQPSEASPVAARVTTFRDWQRRARLVVAGKVLLGLIASAGLLWLIWPSAGEPADESVGAISIEFSDDSTRREQVQAIADCAALPGVVASTVEGDNAALDVELRAGSSGTVGLAQILACLHAKSPIERVTALLDN